MAINDKIKAVKNFFMKSGKRNLIIVCSVVLIGAAVWMNWLFFSGNNDDGYDYSKKLKIDCYCPAYDKSGKLSHDLTCDKCKICFQKKAKVCGCYSH